MWRWISIVVTAVIICTDLNAQEFDAFAVISEFIGIDSEEEIDPEEVERLERYIEHPLRINMANHSGIRESGLLTQYQTASLLDYRSRHGDILSLTELAAVDGFGTDFVKRLSAFISLESGRLPGKGQSKGIYQEVELKGGVRCNDEWQNNYAFKYKIESGESFRAAIAFSKSSDADKPDAFAGNIFWYFRRYSAKLAIGNFNARFGQGLALWNGMSISGLSRPSSYLKRSSNLSASDSYTGNYAFKGIATETYISRLKLTVFAALSPDKDDFGFMPAANLALLLPYGQIGLTHFADFKCLPGGINIPDMKTSCDIAFTFNGLDLFGEAAYDWVSGAVASLTGVVFPCGENLRMAMMLRYYPPDFQPTYSAAARALTKCSNEYGTSVSGEFSAGEWVAINGAEGFGSSSRRFQGSFNLDGSYFPVSKSDGKTKSLQIKSLAEMKVLLTGAIALKLRVSERFRTWDDPFRTDIRTEAFYCSRSFDAAFRINMVRCLKTAFLAYAEGTFKAQSLKLSLRSGLFCADNWEDRIYAYERDIPGSFNVPAFYGRGYWISLTGNWRFARWGRLYIRGAYTDYPFMEKKKPGRAELKLMLKLRI